MLISMNAGLKGDPYVYNGGANDLVHRYVAEMWSRSPYLYDQFL